MLELRNLTIDQGNAPLAGLSLTVKAGERLGISAPSGHGKTTLGRVLAGWQPVRGGGEMLLDGQPLPKQVKGYNPIQLVPQHGTHLQSLSHHRAGAVGCMAPR